METFIQYANVDLQERDEGYREFRVTPTHWFYELPGAAAWDDPNTALSQLDLMEAMIEKVHALSGNVFERREVLYAVLDKLKMTGKEPLTGEVLELIDKVAQEAQSIDRAD